MRRPGGTDGSDHQYRMVIENRYEKLAKQRKLIQHLVSIQVCYTLLRAAWHTVPALLCDEGLPTQELAYAMAGMLAFVLYYKGAGSGVAQYEKIPILKTYTLVALLYASLAALASFQYHVVWDDSLRYHHVYADKLAPKLNISAGIVMAVVKFLAPAIDVVGLTATCLGVYVCKDYCMEKSDKTKQRGAQELAAETNYMHSTGRGNRRRR